MRVQNSEFFLMSTIVEILQVVLRIGLILLEALRNRKKQFGKGDISGENQETGTLSPEK